MSFIARAGAASAITGAGNAQFNIPYIINAANPPMPRHNLDTHCLITWPDQAVILASTPMDIPTTAVFDATASTTVGVPIDVNHGTILAVPGDATYINIFSALGSNTSVMVQWGRAI